jgi:hypothetical protein
MKRTVAILLAVLAAFTLTGLFFAMTKVGPLPAQVRELDWRAIVRSVIAKKVEAPIEDRPE